MTLHWAKLKRNLMAYQTWTTTVFSLLVNRTPYLCVWWQAGSTLGASRVSTLAQHGFTLERPSGCSTDHRKIESLTFFLLITSPPPDGRFPVILSFRMEWCRGDHWGQLREFVPEHKGGETSGQDVKGLDKHVRDIEVPKHSRRAELPALLKLKPQRRLGCAFSCCWDLSGWEPLRQECFCSPWSCPAKTCCFSTARSWWKGRDFPPGQELLFPGCSPCCYCAVWPGQVSTFPPVVLSSAGSNKPLLWDLDHFVYQVQEEWGNTHWTKHP